MKFLLVFFFLCAVIAGVLFIAMVWSLRSTQRRVRRSRSPRIWDRAPGVESSAPLALWAAGDSGGGSSCCDAGGGCGGGDGG